MPPQGATMQSTMQSYFQRNPAANGPSGYMHDPSGNPYPGYGVPPQYQYGQAQPQQQQGPSPMGTMMDIGSGYLEGYGKNQASNALFGGASAPSSASVAGNTAQAGWNAGANSATYGANAGNLAMEQAAGNGMYSQAPGSMMQTPASAGASGGTPLFSMGSPSYAGYAGALYEGYQGYKDLTGNKLRDEDKATRAQQRAALAAADIWTGGLASVAEGAARNWGPTAKILGKIDKLDKRTNPLTLAINKFGTSDKWKTEGNRLRALEEKGIVIPEGWKGAENLTRGRTKDELINHDYASDFVGHDANGGWVNNKFAQSRDEKDLQPDDIVGYSTFGEKFGQDWYNQNLDTQRKIGALALAKNAVDEHHGTIDVKWTPELEAEAKKLLAPSTPTNGKGVAPIAPGNQSGVISAASGLGSNIDPGFSKPVQAIVQSLVPKRSSTSSPGFGKDGKRIQYQIPRAKR